MAPRAFLLTLALTLAIAATALAAPLKGKTYKGSTSTSGKEAAHHPYRLISHSISLKVSSNGKKVTVHISFGHPLFYCSTPEQTHFQETTAAKISANGSFHATIAERFTNSVGGAPITQVVSGRFSGHTVTGTVHTVEPPECSGTTSFSAHA